MGPAAEKRKVIVNVGRFVGPGRADDKHQSTLLEAYRSLKDLRGQGWELHFAGTILRNAKAERHAEKMVKQAHGLPVFFHFNATFSELRDLYRRAAIHWHATGYRLPVDLHPGSQEHFGITTVEAMSAGAVPIVINTGGQRETVTHGVDGFLWEDVEGLLEYTRRVAEDPELRLSLSRNAVESSLRFTRDAFGGRLSQLLAAHAAKTPQA